jgi:hypothetical protein
MHKFPLILSIPLACAGCLTSSGVVSTGGNTYMTSSMAAPVRGGVEGAAQEVYRVAGEECTRQGRQVEVISEETGHDFPANGRDVLRFRCVDIAHN